jgi:hypothetical protein
MDVSFLILKNATRYHIHHSYFPFCQYAFNSSYKEREFYFPFLIFFKDRLFVLVVPMCWLRQSGLKSSIFPQLNQEIRKSPFPWLPHNTDDL